MLNPREILGDKIIDDIRAALYQLGAKLQHVYEIILDVEKSVATVETYSRKISSAELPCTLYFITHLYRSDNSHEVSIIKHEMHPNAKHKTGFDHSLFSFQYRLVKVGAETRFRFDYIKVAENLREQLVKPTIAALIPFVRKEYPDMKVEIRSDSLIAGYMASKTLKEPCFMKIVDPQIHQVGHLLQAEFIKVLEKIGILSAAQSLELCSLIAQSVSVEEKNAHDIKVHNQFLEAIHENLAGPHEMKSFFNQLMKSREGSELVSQSPYQGDLWIEGKQP